MCGHLFLLEGGLGPVGHRANYSKCCQFESYVRQRSSQSSKPAHLQQQNPRKLTDKTKRCVIRCLRGWALWLVGKSNRSINQSSIKSITQPTHQLSNQAINQSINQSVNQSINQSIHQASNQSISPVDRNSWSDLLWLSIETTCWDDLLKAFVKIICWDPLLTFSVEVNC